MKNMGYLPSSAWFNVAVRYLINPYFCLHLEDLKLFPKFLSFQLWFFLRKSRDMTTHVISLHFEELKLLPNFTPKFWVGFLGRDEKIKGHSFDIGIYAFWPSSLCI